jgi:hypothetical protein
MITYIQTAHRDTTCVIWYSKIYLISIHDNFHSSSIHDNLHSNSTQRQ